MARSNNQRRRDAKKRGQTFIPAWTKSGHRNQSNKIKIKASQGQRPKKLPYAKVYAKHGKIKQRKFQSGGFNNSGKNGRKIRSAKGGKKK